MNYYILIVLLIAILIIPTLFIVYKKTHQKEEPTSALCIEWTQKQLTDKRQNNTGFTIKGNDKYTPDQIEYPKELKELAEEYSSMEFFLNNLSEMSVEDLIKYIEDNGGEVDEAEKVRDELTAQEEQKGTFKSIYSHNGSINGGNIDIYVQNGKIQAINYVPSFFYPEGLSNNEWRDFSNSFNEFLENHKSIIGKPQYVYQDELLDFYKINDIDFYLDKGIIFGADRMIIVIPQEENEDFVKLLGLKYFRNLIEDPCLIR